MLQQLISHSPDLNRLVNEGYHIEIRDGHILVWDVPYVSPSVEVKRGMLICPLAVTGTKTLPPPDHTILFQGETPCNDSGNSLTSIINGNHSRMIIPGVNVQHRFSSKPKSGHYLDYYEKMTTYVRILEKYAHMIDPEVTARTHPLMQAPEGESVFQYIDTASSRAGITAIADKLSLDKLAIVGVGGTGGYVLDSISKLPIQEIHLFDDDIFLQHNAFRAPGAASLQELQAKPKKVDYFANRYSQMHRGIKPHPIALDEKNFELLDEMQFVFLCVDGSPEKEQIVKHLIDKNIPFVDTGMGLNLRDETVAGILRTTAFSQGRSDHITEGGRIVYDSPHEDVYRQNIQVADLNMLNAAFAVGKFKKLFGFYDDRRQELHSTYTIDGNLLLNEETPQCQDSE